MCPISNKCQFGFILHWRSMRHGQQMLKPQDNQMEIGLIKQERSFLLSYEALKIVTSFDQLKQSNPFFQVPKLRYFSLKCFIYTDLEFVYLKWLLNNFNYIEKLQLHLRSIETRCQNIWKSFIDANFIRQYCLPDTISNLIYFDFYICSQCQLSFNDIEKITNSFKIHPVFVDHQWTNVKCFV